ncbi:MAG: hypothetical protein D3922_05120, partial [Candidatus Electrothrix sp. AR1]|nr:hypothetical protein [Candidatus Electrothrix sp. AR1]
VTLNHELWRDEVRSILLTTEVDSLSEFIRMAKYDGHPLLWRSILAGMYAIFKTPVVLQMSGLIIGFLSVWLFVKFSPFSLWIKTLFIFGIVPFGTNALMARNYGITMLLFFLFALLLSRPVRRPILTGLVLMLAANTNSFGMYMSGLFLGYWIVDSGWYVLKDRRYIIAIVLTIVGVLFSYYITQAGVDAVFVTSDFMAQIEYGKCFFDAVIHPGKYIWYLLNIDLVYRDIFMTVLVVALAAVRPLLGLTVFVAVVFFNFVGGSVIYPQTRHQGVLLGFIMTAYWLALNIVKSKQQNDKFNYTKYIYYFSLIGFLVPFMLHNISHSYHGAVEEVAREKSSAMALGKYIKANRQLNDAIVIGSPDYAIQPIGYYTDNRIYVAREKHFKKFVTYSKQFKTDMKLSDLLDTAKELYLTHNVPILIALGYFGISEQQPRTFNIMYRGTFEMGKEDIREFNQQTIKLAEFNSAMGDENYQLFLYAEREKLDAYQKNYMTLR